MSDEERKAAADSLRKRLLGDAVSAMVEHPPAVREPKHEACQLAIDRLRAENERLRAEVESLKDRVNEQNLAGDERCRDLTDLRARLEAAERERASRFDLIPAMAELIVCGREAGIPDYALEEAEHAISAARAPSDEHCNGCGHPLYVEGCGNPDCELWCGCEVTQLCGDPSDEGGS